MEQYKDIQGYEGYYQISNLGNVKNVITNKVKKNRLAKTGYYDTILCVNQVKKCIKIHRLVAIAFIPNTLNKSDVNHIDGNKANNIVENLEWCTKSENSMHSYKILNNTVAFTKVTKPVKNIKTGQQYNSIREAAKDLNLNPGTLYYRLIGKVKNSTDLVFA